MGRRRTGARLPVRLFLLASLLAGLLMGVLLPGGVSAAEESGPTVDPTAPTPTTPHPGGPPQGHAPDGSTVGGTGLDTRGVVVTDSAPPLPTGLGASGWLVADAGTGAVLAARDPHGRYYPASTLKTLTLLTLAPRLDPATVVVGTREDEQIEGSRVGLVTGGEYPVGLLFEALILQSGNDAANALARAAGGVAETVAAMNDTARSIGAYDTVAGTPSGLDVAGQSSSPYDLALIFRKLVEDPGTAAVLRVATADMPAVPGRSPGYQIQSQNPLLTTYPGNLGGKTGFTDAARHTFVTAAERDGRRLVVSVMQTENVPLRAADQAALLLDWGFSVPAASDGVGRLVEPADLVPSGSRDGLEGSAGTAVPAQRATGAAPSSGRDRSSPLVPAALGVGAVAIVAATVIGRRRAVRPVSVPAGGGAAGFPRHPARPLRPAGRTPGAQGTGARGPSAPGTGAQAPVTGAPADRPAPGRRPAPPRDRDRPPPGTGGRPSRPR